MESPEGLAGAPVRAFFGVGLPGPARERLAAYLERCREAAPGFRWTPAANLHLTLRFLGRVDEDRLRRLVGRLRGVAVTPFRLGLGGAGSFGQGRAARVAWLGVDEGRAELGELAALVEARCGLEGFAPEGRPYRPHLTLARARDRRGAPLPPLPPPPEIEPWTVTGYQLYQSLTGSGGAVYRVLDRLP